ncbi:MAG: alpha/beta fold hydrolase [Hydrogenophaga sp.]|nr:alpha/beta fold hydrolase [Hydrogenophaga sp.]
MGIGSQMVFWDDELVDRFVAQGFQVIRFDHRDIGLSSRLDHLPVPRPGPIVVRSLLSLPVAAPYTLSDMAGDVIGLLDHLGLDRVHVVGVSMGGMIAQHLAATAPGRVASLTLMMTTSGARSLPQPSWPVRRVLMSRPMRPGQQAAVDWIGHVLRVIGSPAYPMDTQAMQARALASVQRSWHPAGSARQLLAVVADGDRTPMLSRIQAPTLVIHGVDDPLVPFACGQDLARRIAGARTDFITGMGHDLPEPLLTRFADAIADHAALAGT